MLERDGRDDCASLVSCQSEAAQDCQSKLSDRHLVEKDAVSERSRDRSGLFGPNGQANKKGDPHESTKLETTAGTADGTAALLRHVANDRVGA